MAALQDFGLIMQSTALLDTGIAAGRLVVVSDDVIAPAWPMHILSQKDRQATPKLMTSRAFFAGTGWRRRGGFRHGFRLVTYLKWPFDNQIYWQVYFLRHNENVRDSRYFGIYPLYFIVVGARHAVPVICLRPRNICAFLCHA